MIKIWKKVLNLFGGYGKKFLHLHQQNQSTKRKYMKKTRLNDILCWVITLCVIFMGGAVVHQMHYHTQENGLWVTIPFAIAIIAVVILNFTEDKD